jgi:hypothetical protein
MELRTRVEWYPPEGAMIAWTTGRAVPYRLDALDGLGAISVQPRVIQSPGQVGVTAVDIGVPARVVTLQGRIQASDRVAAWSARSLLSRALTVQPRRPGEQQKLGRLRVMRPGLPAVELLATVQSPHVPAPPNGVGIVPHDVEWLAPNPYWREISDSTLIFQSAEGGFSWPLEMPFEPLSNNVQQEIHNEGDVDAAITARIYGECTTPRLLNVTTGEVLEIVGAVADGEYLEISTEFADQRVELVATDGSRTSVMDRLNLEAADFWRLRPGTNAVRFEADSNPSGRAEVRWRQKYGGI